MKAKDISVELHLNDGFTLWAIVEGYLVKRRYLDYTVKDAKREFIAEHTKGGRK